MRSRDSGRRAEESLRVPYSKLQLLADLICGALIASVILFLILSWPEIPDRVALHYNTVGEVDRWGGKSSLLWLTGMMVFMYALLKVCALFPRFWNMPIKITDSNRDRVLLISKNMLAAMNAAMVLMFSYLIFTAPGGEPLNLWVFLPLMALIFMPIVVYFIYIRKIASER